MNDKEEAMEKMEVLTRDEVLNAALAIEARQAGTYGKAERSFETIADLWNGYLSSVFGFGIALTPSDIAVMMALMKVARISSGVYHADNFVDAANYLALASEVYAGEK